MTQKQQKLTQTKFMTVLLEHFKWNKILFKIYEEDLEDDLEDGLEYLSGEGICILTKCKHIFHKRCVQAWLKSKNTCPFWRKVIN